MKKKLSNTKKLAVEELRKRMLVRLAEMDVEDLEKIQDVLEYGAPVAEDFQPQMEDIVNFCATQTKAHQRAVDLFLNALLLFVSLGEGSEDDQADEEPPPPPTEAMEKKVKAALKKHFQFTEGPLKPKKVDPKIEITDTDVSFSA